MCQSVFMALLAGALGLLLSAVAIGAMNPRIAAHWKIEELSELLVLPGKAMMGIALAVVLICAVAALVPSWRASKKTPMDAIRETAS